MTAAAREIRSKSQPRRGLRRVEAAIYVGVSPTKFDDWVKRGLMPKPKRQDDIVVWDQLSLDSAFEALRDEGERAGQQGSSSWN
jgi:predicted DNA-binding transcriptional regulator AlpA